MDDFEPGYRPRRRWIALGDILPFLVCAVLGAALGSIASGEYADFHQTQKTFQQVTNRDFLSADALGPGRELAAEPAPQRAAGPNVTPVFSGAILAARSGVVSEDASQELASLSAGTRRAVLGRINAFGPASLAQ